MVLLRRLSNELILSLTTTSSRLLKRAIGEQRGLCLILLAWIDRDRLRHNLARLAIDEVLEDGTRRLTGETLPFSSGSNRARGLTCCCTGTPAPPCSSRMLLAVLLRPSESAGPA